MNSFILIDGVTFWVMVILTMLTLLALIWKSLLKFKADRRLMRENKRLKAEIRMLRFELLNKTMEEK